MWENNTQQNEPQTPRKWPQIEPRLHRESSQFLVSKVFFYIYTYIIFTFDNYVLFFTQISKLHKSLLKLKEYENMR